MTLREKIIEKDKTLAMAAQALGCSRVRLSQILSGDRAGPKMLKALRARYQLTSEETLALVHIND